MFAPTNDAFPDDTSGIDVEQVFLYHVVGAQVPSTAIPAMADTPTQPNPRSPAVV